jgi:PAS domain S-box-containing protein
MPDRSLDPVLLIASSTPTHPLVEALTELARNTNLPVNVCSQEKALECLGEMIRAGREPSAIVLLHDIEQPLALARYLYKNALTSQFVFVVTQAQEPALRRQMMLAPLIGSNWTIVPPEPKEVLKATRHAARMTKQRKQLRTTLDRFNVRLAGEAARDTEKYRKLVISDRHLASILEHAQDIIITLNQRGSILSWNDGAAKQYGRVDALGQSITTLVVPQQREELLASVQQAATENVAVLRQFHGLRADGSIFHAEFQLAPVRDERGHVIAVSLLGRDVTVRVQAEQELERRVEERTAELQTAVQELEAFSYSVSHDLRAPLRGINGFSQALAEDYGPSLDDVARDYLRRIQAGASRMGELIDDLLNLSRVSRRVSRKEQVDLSEVARQVTMQLKDTHPERHVMVRIQDNVLVEGDRRLLTVVLENLLGNAWKFTRDQVGSPSLTVIR